MDGKTSKRARHVVIVVVIVLAVFAAAEGAVRVRASVLPLPARWVGPEMPLKERQIDVLQHRGGASVIFVGSSVSDVSVDPSAMHPPPGARPYYNASTGAGSLRMIATWTRVLAVPKLRPDVVVLGVISREFTPNDPEQQRLDRQFFAAPAVRRYLGTETMVQKVDRRIDDLSALFRYRTFVRQPKYLRALLGVTSVENFEYGSYVAPDGQYQDFLNREYPDRQTVARLFRGRALRNYEVGNEQLRTFRSLMTFLKAHVKRVIVVNMPVTEDYVASHPRGEADFRSYADALTKESELLDVELLDMGIWSSRYFADPAHLNARGSERISRRLDEIVAERTR